jgi:alkanesulfonate monooxygenase SsuD/methylene tetrahydromethanopterin reductase-like flavin-dependent oxidoreductase (luciferase family)
MRLSIWPGPHQPIHEVMATARHADETGWGGVYFADHFMMNSTDGTSPGVETLECTAVLAALAATTTRVRLGSLVLGNTYRHPAVVAKWAATVDHVSRGRLVLGIGAGWQENEHREYGIDKPPPRELVDRFEEACQVMVGLLRAPRTTFDGAQYQLSDAECEPKPVQHPLPVLIGGKGDRMLGIVARHADEWNMWATPEMLRERGAVLDARCESIGRDPATVGRSTQALVHLTDDAEAAAAFERNVAPRPAVAGTPERFAEYVAGCLEEGADEVIVPDFTLAQGTKRLDEMDLLRESVSHLLTD